METYRVIGLKRVNYISKKTNRPVSGYNVFVMYPLHGDGCQGNGCENVYMSDTVLAGSIPTVGTDIRIYYNRFGGVAAIELA